MRVEFNEALGVAEIWPEDALTEEGFKSIAATIDPWIEEHGKLAGIIIATEKFPGWSSFGALVSHMRFVRDHHRDLERIALVTDSPIGDIAEDVVDHFVAAKLEHFEFDELGKARDWVAGG